MTPSRKKSFGDPSFCEHPFHTFFFLTISFFVADPFEGLTVLQAQTEFPHQIQSLKLFLQSSRHILHRPVLFHAALIHQFLAITNRVENAIGPFGGCLYRGRNVMGTATVKP